MDSKRWEDAVVHPTPEANFTVRSGGENGEDCFWCGGEIDPDQGVSVELEVSSGRKQRVLVHEYCRDAAQDAEPF